MTEYRITLKVTRYLKFTVDDKDVGSAMHGAISGYTYGDLHPDEEECATLEVYEVATGDLEISVDEGFDWSAPKVKGLTPRLFRAYDGTKELAKGRDLAEVVGAGFAALVEQSVAGQ